MILHFMGGVEKLKPNQLLIAHYNINRLNENLSVPVTCKLKNCGKFEDGDKSVTVLISMDNLRLYHGSNTSVTQNE